MLYKYWPNPGDVLTCDFSRGFVAPEMLKQRQVVVISPKASHSRLLCTVVPLSCTAPFNILPCHYQLTTDPCPTLNSENEAVWAKCDMLYTVSFERLDKLHKKTRKGREYFIPQVTPEDYQGIIAAVRSYLNFL